MKDNKKLYIVIASNGVGGAERRFVDIFKGLVEQGHDCYLVLPSFLKNRLLNELDVFFLNNVIYIDMNKWSYLAFCYKLYFLLIRSQGNETHFYYPLNPPFFLHLLNNKCSYSISFCHSSLVPKITLKSYGLTMLRLASIFAKNIDVLNQPILEEFLISNPWAKNKCSLTPKGTYVSKTGIGKIKEKYNKFVFMSRLIENKGVDVFIKLVPEINRILADMGIVNPSFHIAGEGPLSEYVIHEVKNLKAQDINIYYEGFCEPRDIFKDAICVFSLQNITNFPSRVIAEALCHGCHVIALDTGDTKNFGNLAGLHYLDIEYKYLNEIIKYIISFEAVVARRISTESIEYFSSKEYIDYFYNLAERI